MPRHTITQSISSANGFTREVSLPGAGDLPHLVDVFGLARAVLLATLAGEVPAAISPIGARAPDAGKNHRPEPSRTPPRTSAKERPGRLH